MLIRIFADEILLKANRDNEKTITDGVPKRPRSFDLASQRLGSVGIQAD